MRLSLRLNRMNIAQINISKLRYPKHSPEVDEFTKNISRINLLAQKCDGYVWHLEEESAGARYFEDPLMLANLSIWTSINDLRRFVYRTNHGDFVKHKTKWFKTIQKPVYALWWTQQKSGLTLDEGMERLKHLRAFGASQKAFTFSSVFS